MWLTSCITHCYHPLCLSVIPRVQVLACTWNVNENKPSTPGLELWLGERVKDAQLVLIGLQVSAGALPHTSCQHLPPPAERLEQVLCSIALALC